MARSHFRELKNPLARALEVVARAGAVQALAPLWSEAVGPFLAQRSRLIQLDGSTLRVEIEPELQAELAAQSEPIRARLNSLLGHRGIDAIVWTGWRR